MSQGEGEKAPPSAGLDGASSPGTASSSEPSHLPRRRARGLTLWAILALLLSPFSVPTFGAGFVLGVSLIIVCVWWWRRRGLDTRRPLVAGIVAVCLSLLSAGACGVLFLKPAEVEGREARRQGRIEDRFDRAFNEAEEAPGVVDGGPVAAPEVAVDDDAADDAGAPEGTP